MKFNFELTGVTPILFHADDIVLNDDLKRWQLDPENAAKSVAGDDRSPPWTWQTYLYGDGEHLTIPQENILASIRWAGAKVIMKKQTTYKSKTQSGLAMASAYCRFDGPKEQVRLTDIEKLRTLSFAEQFEAVKALGFCLFVKRAAVGASKHVRVRARFNQWKVSGQIEIVDPDISPEMLKKIMDIAGDSAGILDWRPSAKKSPGPFGRYAVSLKPTK